MDNLHRELAPISGAAWDDLEDEARRTFRRHVAGRRIVDVAGPAGPELSAVGTGHLQHIDHDSDGVTAHTRRAQQIVELRVPFTVDRLQVDDVERGAKDADWQPAKDAARQLAFAEDRAIFEGYAAAGIAGIRASSSNPAIALPNLVRDYPNAISAGRHGVTTGRGQRPLHAGAGRRCLHRGQRDHRQGISDLSAHHPPRGR